MKESELDILKKALARERSARKAAEKILEEKSLELYNKNVALEAANNNLSKVIDERTEEINSILNNVQDSYILMDLDGNVLKMNAPAKELFGFDIDQGDAFNVNDILYEEDIDYAAEAFENLLENKIFRNYESRIYTKNKEVKWVQINSSIISDNESNAMLAHGIVRDITADKKNRELILQQKQQLDAIVDHSPVGIVLTKEGKIVKSNQAFEDLLGYSTEELLTLHVKDITFPEDASMSKDYMQAMNAGEIDNFSINKRYMTKDQGILWAKTNVSAVRTRMGTIDYQVALVEDITEEMKKSALLHGINQLMSSILGKTDIQEIAWQVTNNIAGILDLEDCVIYRVDEQHKVMRQIAVYGEKLIGKEEIANQITLQEGQGIVGAVAKTGIAEIVHDTSKDDRYVVDDEVRFSEIAVPILVNDKVIGVIDSEHPDKHYFTNEDLEVMKTIASLVSTIFKYAISLEQREVAEQAKEEALKSMRKSNKELNDFAHVVSHDLKSPLRSMNALVHWIQEDLEGNTSPEVQSNFELLLQKIDRMDLLINGILSYASIDKSKETIKEIDLNSVVKDVVESIHIPEHIQLTVDSNLPVLRGDHFKFSQLFQNLIGNAIKYNDKEQGLVSLLYTNEPDQHLFEIRDNGKGIEERYFDKIFKVFEVLEVHEDSTGVGLSIVKKIVDFYGGKVWVTSELGTGTSFFIQFPK